LNADIGLTDGRAAVRRAVGGEMPSRAMVGSTI
jgi:hypothetical protein